VIVPDVNLLASSQISGLPQHAKARRWWEDLLDGDREIGLAAPAALLCQSGTAGNLTTDAQLAAIAIEHQGEVHSNDTDFGRVPGLRWVNPLR
jgi:hypothetical protein